MDLINYLDLLDKKLLIFLNSLHTPSLDSFMLVVTHRFTWIPFYLLIIFFLWWKEKRQAIYILLTIVAMTVTADLFASSLLKPTVQRMRPCHDASINTKLHILPDTCGGQFGFISSHAANTFALATFLVIFYYRKYKWSLILLVWAAVVSYSRIYLGVHFPGDIIAGALSGIFWAILYLRIYTKAMSFMPQYKSEIKTGRF